MNGTQFRVSETLNSPASDLRCEVMLESSRDDCSDQLAPIPPLPLQVTPTDTVCCG